MICVYQAANGLEAAIVSGLLEEHDIRCQVLGQWLSSGAGELPVDQYPRVMILDDRDAPQAEALIRDYAADVARAPSWTCRCGETHEGRFTHCWKCGAPRADV